jgi:hypothetical protein
MVRGPIIRGIASFVALSAVAALLTGCDTMVTALAGEPHGPQGAAPKKKPSPFATNYGFTQSGNSNGLDLQGSGLTGQTILPSTGPMTQNVEPEPLGPEPTTGDTGPRSPVAVAPLVTDPARLTGLGTAAARAGMRQDARFVLLVLTPPAADAAAIGQASAQSRAAADAALKAITDAGIAADRIEVAAATAPASGDGEMRLYVR